MYQYRIELYEHHAVAYFSTFKDGRVTDHGRLNMSRALGGVVFAGGKFFTTPVVLAQAMAELMAWYEKE
jgi:hypothetical protein